MMLSSCSDFNAVILRKKSDGLILKGLKYRVVTARNWYVIILD